MLKNEIIAVQPIKIMISDAFRHAFLLILGMKNVSITGPISLVLLLKGMSSVEKLIGAKSD